MKYQIHLTGDVEQDILELFDFISNSDSGEKAYYVYKNIKDKCFSLEYFPDKGHFPPELERIGITEYREIHFKLFRIIYQVSGNNVFIYCVLDGRRDLQELLERRLIR